MAHRRYAFPHTWATTHSQPQSSETTRRRDTKMEKVARLVVLQLPRGHEDLRADAPVRRRHRRPVLRQPLLGIHRYTPTLS
ncbi:hypothetical protein HMN09_01405100 [Mycena chlorophos]|uniref:Uncharacterized protein n=1 Tax=Mycena chlorophos TaxID=658473 RepID=A0A8H6RWR8_MYCCL|nr:hypothetical protein HMN09_01405100 [Mycena chlorophos]